MSKLNLEKGIAADLLLLAGNRWGVVNQTLTATFAVPVDAPHVLALDPGGASRNVTLPASPQIGDWFVIINTADAAEVITVQDSAGAGLTPAITPTQNEIAYVYFVGGALGWRGAVALGA